MVSKKTLGCILRSHLLVGECCSQGKDYPTEISAIFMISTMSVAGVMFHNTVVSLFCLLYFGIYIVLEGR